MPRNTESARPASPAPSNSRVVSNSTPPFDPNLPNTAATNVSQPVDRPVNALPKVGETRCYWALLSADLNFLYLDPVLQSHLAEQAELLIGKTLITFVHPDEQKSAKQDLGSVLESRTLHGSVTRVRFSRLSRIRRELGFRGTPATFPDIDKVTLDQNYMAVDIVINWAAEGLVLCFIHAVVDINPVDDNNEQHKSAWTNWCGTPVMDSNQAQLLYQRLGEHVPNPGNMRRVFQILLNRPERPLWMSWPPDGSTDGPTSRDFAKLAEEVQIANTTHASDAKTSCTRRYKALQPIYMGPEGHKQVESIFIPYGAIIFSCHKVDSYPRDPQANGNPVGYASHYPPHSQPIYDPNNHYDLPPMSGGPPYNYVQVGSGPHPAGAFHPNQQWPEGANGQYGNEWPSPSVAPSTSNVRSGMYPSDHQNSHTWSSLPPSYNLDPSHPGHPRSIASYNNYSQTGGEGHGSDGGSASDVPPPRSGQRRGSARDQYGTGGRSTGKPPVGIQRCSSCKVTQSPEWRKGPSGKKDLCNACGLRYARSRAKKEGGSGAKRRKDKAFPQGMKQEGSTPPPPPGRGVHPSSHVPSLRRATFNESFIGTPPEPGSSYEHPPHSGPSPSPSPPSRGPGGFANYPPRQNGSPAEIRANQFSYPIPPPTTTHPGQLSPRSSGPSSVPRLGSTNFSGQNANGGNRVASTSSNSSSVSATHASSFERDSAGGRARDRVKRDTEAGSPPHMPPTSIPSPGDWSKRSSSYLS